MTWRISRKENVLSIDVVYMWRRFLFEMEISTSMKKCLWDATTCEIFQRLSYKLFRAIFGRKQFVEVE